MKKRRIIAGVSVLLGLIIVLCVALMLAKYKMNLGEQSELTSQNFYFSSNFLKSDEVPTEVPTYEIYGNTVTFRVRNYIDSFRVNATNINYTVTADFGILNKTEGTLAENTSDSQEVKLTYDFLNDEDQKEVTVTATGTGNFTKTLSAKFIFIKYDGLKYEIKDQANRDYAELYIYTGKTASNVRINWDKAKLLIDETNDYIFGKVQNKTSPEKSYVVIENIAADTTVKIVFFKNDIKANYTLGIKKSDGTITIS